MSVPTTARPPAGPAGTASGRGRIATATGAIGSGVLALTVAAWAIVLALLLRHRVFTSHDTMISYAHVWYVSTQLWHGHGIPFRMPVVGHGEGYAFSYGFVPWMTAALVRPLLGDWAVTLWIALGAAGTALATFFALPELRSRWWAVAVLVNPALVAAPLIGQLPFLWGSALLFLAVGCWRRDRRTAAIVFAALAQITHPAVLMPIALGTVLGRLPFERHRGALLRAYALSVAFALPAVWIVLRSPVFVDSSLQTKLLNFVSTVAPRSLIVAVPFALALMQRYLRASRLWVAPLSVAVLIGSNIAMGPVMGMPQAWRTVWRPTPPGDLDPLFATGQFEKGATYRVLLTSNGKYGEYQLLRHGGKLDGEFFPESMAIQSWPNAKAYSDALVRRRVDFVVDFHAYDKRWKKNEHALLEQLSRLDPTGCADHLVGVRHLFAMPRYEVYAIDRACASHPH